MDAGAQQKEEGKDALAVCNGRILEGQSTPSERLDSCVSSGFTQIVTVVS